MNIKKVKPITLCFRRLVLIDGYVAMLADSIDRTERAVNSDMVYLSSVFGGFEELSEAYLDYLRLLPEKTYVPEDMLIQE